MIPNIWRNLKKYALPTVMSCLTFDAWLTGRQNEFKTTYYERAYKSGVAKEQATTQAQAEAELATKTLESKIAVVSNTQVQKGEITQENAKSHLEYYQSLWSWSLQTEEGQVKELKVLSTSKDPDILKSDLSEYIFNLIDLLKDYVSMLSSEQLVILFNLSGYILLFMIFTTIAILLIGNDLINYYELEWKFPKLARYIQFQLKLRKFYLKFYILYLYFVILVFFSLNIFMFLYDYL